jgi:uncharacterized membrane protein YbhN (UPF0104 family)
MLLFYGFIWSWLLRELGIDAGPKQAMSIFNVSQFGKYLPGNVAHHVGRVVLARDVGWQTGRVVLSMMIETGAALGTGALVAGVGGLLLAMGGAWDRGRVTLAFALMVAGSVAGALALRYLLARPPAWLKRWLAIEDPIDLRVQFLAAYLAVHVASHVSMGIALAVLLRGISGTWPSNVWTVPVGVTIAWLAGFVVPGAPAGLGVREAALTSLLGGSLGTSAVISAALAWRLTTSVTDALLFCLGLLLRREGAAPSAPHVP